jgi:hypothetical protein
MPVYATLQLACMLLVSDALERLAETTPAGGNDWGLGIEARSRALVTEGQSADGWLPRGDRPAGPYRISPGARPRLSALRRVAAPPGPPRAGPGAAAHRPRPVRQDRDGSIRRTGQTRAGGDRGNRPQAHHAGRRRGQREADPRRLRSRGWPETACPTRRLVPDCSSAPTPSSTTSPRSSRSSASAPGVSFTACCPAARTLSRPGVGQVRVSRGSGTSPVREIGPVTNPVRASRPSTRTTSRDIRRRKASDYH